MIVELQCSYCGSEPPADDDWADLFELDVCAGCNRIICMECALLSFDEDGHLTLLCRACGLPTDQFMRELGEAIAPQLFLSTVDDFIVKLDGEI